MNQKSGFISTIVLGISLLLFIGSTFCFFGPALIRLDGSNDASMFAYMFGTAEAIYSLLGLQWVFGLQIAVIVLIAISVVAVFKKWPMVMVVIFMVIACICSIVALILSFNTVDFYQKLTPGSSYGVQLGGGAIAYSVINIVAVVGCLVGSTLSRRGL